MSSTNVSTSASLADTLIHALAQCQEQVEILAEQSKVVDSLREENHKLQQEVQQLRTQFKEAETQYAAQFQEIFKQVAEKQAEVDRSKDKLRAIKIKARAKGIDDTLFSSPAISSKNAAPIPPQTPLALETRLDADRKQGTEKSHDHHRSTQLQAPKKRRRSASPLVETLKEISPNVNTGPGRLERERKDKQTVKRRSLGNENAPPISEIAEDGENNLYHAPRAKKAEKSLNIPQAVYSRLDDLLAAPGPRGHVLGEPSSLSPQAATNMPQEFVSTKATSAAFGLLTPHGVSRPKKPRVSWSPSTRTRSQDPEDEEPFRSRPLHRLGLAHFKLNPAANDGLDYAYHEVVRGQQRKCLPGCTRDCCVETFKALAASMPDFTGPNGQRLTDDELLLGFLGAGSEEKIKALTPVARENLMHDAKTKLVADSYGKMHRSNHERGRSPPGFWRTDMPGSQEHREDRASGKAAERDEVKRRYDEAMVGGGRWIFADE